MAGPRPNAPRTWTAVALEVPRGREDELAGLLAADSLGAEIAPGERGRSRLSYFVGSPDEAARALRRAESLLRRAGLEPLECRLHLRTVVDGRWVESYQASLAPFDLGRGFRVFPAAEPAPDAGRQAIVLTPGRAFGTGEHPTTRLCVEMLERRVVAGSRWIDLGCGTALLSIVARHCGAGHVLALDHDAEALDVAREVLRSNGLSGSGIVLRRGSTPGPRHGAVDGVVANISAGFLTRHASELAAWLEPGGLLIASGLLEAEVEPVAAALRAADLVEIDRRAREGWAAMLAGNAAR